jgi:hypothetical protein
VIQKNKLILGLFIFQFILSCIDLIIIGVSPIYRSAIGNIKSNTDLMFRVCPSLYVFIACGACLYFYLNTKIYSKAIIYVVITLFMISTILSSIPFAGMFFILLTPISLLYYGTMIWLTQYGYITILIVLGLYLVLNILIIMKLKNEKIIG